MKFLLRNAIFILFPVTMVAIIYLANLNLGAALRFGEWGERSVAESTLIVNQEKVERLEEVIRSADDTFMGIVNPLQADEACEGWQREIQNYELVEAAAVIDESGEIAAFYYLDVSNEEAHRVREFIETEVISQLNKYDSLDQYKHIHKKIGDEYRFFTHYTTLFRGEDYTTVLLFNTKELVEVVLSDLIRNVGEDRVANVVDDQNNIILGDTIDGTGPFIIARRFPTTLYKWRLQIAPTAAALFNAEAKAQAQRFSRVMLIPMAFGIIVLGLVVLYSAVMRERRLNRLRSDFIANVSHELRTPLSLIRMFGELLLMPGKRDKVKSDKYAEVILRETDRLAALVDNVLDLARIEQGRDSYSFEIVDIKEAVDRAVEVYRQRLETMGICLVYTKDPNLPEVRADGHADTMSVINLLDNAAKYATGTDEVGVTLSREDGHVLIQVYDHGPGIPAAGRRRVFERFYRVPTTETRKQRGSGIGLNLVKHIAESHKGKVEVESEPGVLTRFTIRIPIRS